MLNHPQQTPSFVREFPADTQSVRDARRFVAGEMEEMGAQPECIDAVILAVSEATTNAIRHSNADRFTVALQRTDDDVVVTVGDRGDGTSRTRDAEGRRLDQFDGRGLPIMDAVVDDVAFRSDADGTIVTITHRAF